MTDAQQEDFYFISFRLILLVALTHSLSLTFLHFDRLYLFYFTFDFAFDPFLCFFAHSSLSGRSRAASPSPLFITLLSFASASACSLFVTAALQLDRKQRTNESLWPVKIDAFWHLCSCRQTKSLHFTRRLSFDSSSSSFFCSYLPFICTPICAPVANEPFKTPDRLDDDKPGLILLANNCDQVQLHVHVVNES